MVTDRQVRRLMSLLQTEQSLQVCADKVGMDRQTAGKYRKLGKLPSQLPSDHAWRTRSDPFAAVWPWVAEQLAVNPGLEAKTLLAHYGLLAEKTNPNRGHENGDVEQRHHRFKRAVDQALMLRGSRDFADIPAYRQFLKALAEHLNRGRRARLAEELPVLGGLPPAPLEAVKRLAARVDCGSLIHVDRNAYSVNSRLIGQQVEVRLYVGHLEVWYGQKKVEQLPRLPGRHQHRVNYRHVIDWLVRKPGAFADYRYQADLFPSSLFRVAYDRLQSQYAGSAAKQYLKILELAARENQALVEAAIARLCELDQAMSFEAVEALVLCGQKLAAPTVVRVQAVDLSAYDQLLDGDALAMGLGVDHE